MGELRTSTTATTTSLFSLAGQVAALSDMVARISQTLVPEPNPAPPRVVPSSPAPVVPERESPEPQWEPHLPPPKPHAREFDRCRGFLGLCQLQFRYQPSRFRSDGAKVALNLSSLTDRAGRLHQIQQGSRSVAEYTLEFRTLASDSGWDDNALRSAYRRGLSEEIKDLLVRDRPPTFNDLVTLTLQVDERLRERHLEWAQHVGVPARSLAPLPGGRYSPHPGPTSTSLPVSRHAPLSRTSEEEEPMQLGRLRLSPETREQRMPVLREGGAHHPGLPGSAKRPSSLGGGVLVSRADFIPPSGGTNSLFLAILAWGLETLSVGALLDSGADECLIDVTLAHQAGIPLEPMDETLSTQALDGHSMGKITHRTAPLSLTLSGNHIETIQLLVIHAPMAPLVLGRPWLNKHDPKMNWSSGRILGWSAACLSA